MVHELERNKWALKNFRKHLENFEWAINENGSIQLLDEASGHRRIELLFDGEMSSSSLLADVYADTLSNNLLEIAVNDESIFETVLDAYDALKELQHLHDNILVRASEPFNCADGTRPDFIESFIEYAKAELDLIEKDLAKLYRQCTGKDFENFRLR
ncbi:MAG: hypothetical protein COB78_07890 [Hyphomicrobiales bacterium]|nr:MAG: hypothetical protein COB78_07890 [Hyphomicrobiales bacterium]